MNPIEQTPNQKRMAKAFEWMKLVSVTGLFQVLIQAVGFISGMLIIRELPTDERAIYFMANNILGTMVILADGGITNGVMALGAKVANDPKQLGIVMNTGLDLRKKFALGSIVIAAPILVYMLVSNDVSLQYSFLIFISVLPMFYSSLSGNLLEIVAKIKQDIVPLQTVKVKFNVARLILTLAFIFIFPFAYLVILITAIPQFWANHKLKKNADQFVDFSQSPDPEVRGKILKIVARILPGAAYYSIYSQISIYLITFFSDNGSQSIAEVGGLDKLSMVLGIVTTLFVTLIMPRYARLPDEKGILFNRWIQIMALMVVVCAGIIGGVWLFDDFLLNILGPDYMNLNAELLLSITAACLGMMAGNVYSLFTNRGWNIHPTLSIALSILTVLIGGYIFRGELGTVKGVLKFNIYCNILNLSINSLYLLYKINLVHKIQHKSQE